MPRLTHALSRPNDKPSTGHYKITQFCYLPRYCRRYSTECLADHTALGDKNEGNRLTVIATDRAGQSGFCCRLSAKRHWRLFCINDDGTTTDTVPNEVNGMDTYSNNGGYTSSLPDRSGADEALEGSSLSTQQGVGSGQSDSALAGRDWHSPANLNDGAATSSMSLLDKP